MRTLTDHSRYIGSVVQTLTAAGLDVDTWEAPNGGRDAYIRLAVDEQYESATVLTWRGKKVGWRWGYIDAHHPDKGIQGLADLMYGGTPVPVEATPAIVTDAVMRLEVDDDGLDAAYLPADPGPTNRHPLSSGKRTQRKAWKVRGLAVRLTTALSGGNRG